MEAIPVTILLGGKYIALSLDGVMAQIGVFQQIIPHELLVIPDIFRYVGGHIDCIGMIKHTTLQRLRDRLVVHYRKEIMQTQKGDPQSHQITWANRIIPQ